MKRTLLFISYLLASLTMPAQVSNSDDSDYIPFVELGKQLHLVIVSNPKYSHSTGRYWMCKEMEYNGKTYIYTYLPYDVMAVVEEVGLLREENRRVYMYDKTTDREIMLYDFSLKEGDTFTYEYGFDQPVNCKVLKQGWLEDGPKIVTDSKLTSDHKYRPLRTWTIGRDNGTGGYDEVVTWVEGIGTLENMFSPLGSSEVKYCLTYVERQTDSWVNEYLPFSVSNLFDMFGQIHSCNLPTGEKNNEEDDRHHKLTYELEGVRLHVYGEVFCNCGPNHYAYFRERNTDDPLVHKIEFFIQEVEPTMNCAALHETDFYVPGFDPNLSYIVVDNQGEEHPVINKASEIVYRPMIEDDKVWKVGYGSRNPIQFVEYYYFDGDTIIDGRTCKQMMCQRYVSPDYEDYEIIMRYPLLRRSGFWYEEDKKVYTCSSTNKQLMYDFSLDAYDTLHIDPTYLGYVLGPRQIGGIKGFKGVYRDVLNSSEGEYYHNITWLEGVGSIEGPTWNVYYGKEYHGGAFLMSCSVGDEVIYLNDDYEDRASPEAMDARNRIDFTHTIKTRPKAPRRSEAEGLSLYGEYNDQQLSINLDPLDDAYLVRITDETGNAVYEKTVNAGSIVGLNIDISDFARGCYTVTVENSSETFTGEFVTITTGIEDINLMRTGTGACPFTCEGAIYNVQGQRLSTLQNGLNIVNGQKVYVK